MSTPAKHALTLIALLALLAATVGAAYLPLGKAHGPVTFLISTAKAVLVLGVFMRFTRATPLSKLAFAAGLFWFLLLVGLGLSDYLTRF